MGLKIYITTVDIYESWNFLLSQETRTGLMTNNRMLANLMSRLFGGLTFNDLKISEWYKLNKKS